jgi:hypothetical protein
MCSKNKIIHCVTCWLWESLYIHTSGRLKTHNSHIAQKLSTITPHKPIEAKDYIGNATGQINNVHLESGCAKINGYTNKCLISSLVMLLRGLIAFSCAGDVRLMITEKRVMYR